MKICSLFQLLEIDAEYPEYLWHPEVLANASHSSEYLAFHLNSEISSGLAPTGEKLKKHINKKYVKKGLGIMDASDEELQHIVDQPLYAVYYFANMISRRAQIGWSTHGHSAVDVNIYGTAGSDGLRGNNENTDIGKFLREYLNVDVDKITEELIEGSKSFNTASRSGSDWTGKVPSQEDLLKVSRHHEALQGKAP